MATIFIGTAFNQVIKIHSEDKHKTKTVYGAQARHPVLHISHYPYNDHTVYSTSKTINSIQKEQTNEIVQIHGPEKIIDVQLSSITGKCSYTLSNGAIYFSYEIQDDKTQLEQIFIGEQHNLYTGAVKSQFEDQSLLFGKGVVPMIVNRDKSVVTWRGKNVKHDQLDLEVPINDVAAKFINKDKFLAILNANNKLRVYDIRGTHKRPVKDLAIKTTSKTNLTNMLINNDESKYYISNEGGEVLQLDSRKDFQMSAKYKGIGTTVTGLSISQKWVVTSSLDCYVRVFDINQRTELKKFYFNKPINSLCVSYQQQQQQENVQELQHYEEQIQLSQQQEQNQKKEAKVKHIRKRNKVGLKYLRPREFDTPEEMPVKEEEGGSRKAWLKQLNPIDRLQFQQQE